MKKTFYVQTDEQQRIRDIIEFPYSDYKEVHLNTPLPVNVLSGNYELVGESVVYRREWDTRSMEQEQRLEDLETTIAAVMFGGETI